MKKKFIFLILILFFNIGQIEALTKAPVDITTMSIEDLLHALDNGYLTSETLVKLYLERIEEYDKLFNSINQINEHALDQAKKLDKERASGNIKGRLHGIPILVKCNIDVYGLPTTAGTKSLKDNYPINNATVVQKLIDEGAIILGTTNMSELAFSASNSYSSYGHVKNVFDTSFTPYGSSGGSAVATKAFFAAATLGTDTNSSVRLPASGAGLVGFRPTFGLIGRGGVVPYDYERDTVGILTHTVSDNALILSIIDGYDSRDKNSISFDAEINLQNSSLKGVNIGVPLQYVKGNDQNDGVTGLTDPEIYNMVLKSIDVLKENGANIIYLDDFVKNSNLTIATSTYAGITMCDNFNEYIQGTTGPIQNFEDLALSDGHVQRLSGYLKGCGAVTEKQKKARSEKKAKYRNYVNDYFTEHNLDVIIYPTLKNKVYRYNSDDKNNSPGSSLGSVIGYPSITVPMGFDSAGFSYGLEFLSQRFSEASLYNIASSFEKYNNNQISTSSLAPSLYEIPSNVKKLLTIYEKTLQSSHPEQAEWLQSVKTYFINYNNDENVDYKAQVLLDAYANLNEESSSNNNFENHNSSKKVNNNYHPLLKTIYLTIMYFMITLAIPIIMKNFYSFFKKRISKIKKGKSSISKVKKRKSRITSKKQSTSHITNKKQSKPNTSNKKQSKSNTSKIRNGKHPKVKLK